jgi:hypothetical protein
MAGSKTTEARWRSLVREQESSGKSVQEFARQRGMSAATLYWWRSELGRRGAGRGERIALAPVTVLGTTSPARSRGGAGFEVLLANGRRLCVPRDFDADALRELIAALER